jgi:chromosomal replication initiator protein
MNFSNDPVNDEECEAAVDNSSPVAGGKSVWSLIVQNLRPRVNADLFDRWFGDVEVSAVDAESITLRVPNSIHQYWIADNLMVPLQEAVALSLGCSRTIKFSLPEGGSGVRAKMPPPRVGVEMPLPPTPEEAKGSTPEMNPRNTFATFVVGANNEFGHAACFAVAQGPGRVYNPLFVYGGVGLGKTHLMHAVGHQAIENKRSAKVRYITSERFTNEFIDAIQNNTLVKFRKKYRSVDVLLIDDIQFLGGKERTQDEFFHTFNTLFDGHKQIVLTSDVPPSEIPNLEARLVSRFEWGLTAELQPPDVETRLAILRKKAATLHFPVDASILEFIAERVRSNVRRLEGALMRVASYLSLTGGGLPSIERLEGLMKDILMEEARRSVSIDQIQKCVAEHFDVRMADMTSKRRPKSIAFPRQVAMYLSRERTKHSLMDIGAAFGGRDHGTVLHAHRLVRERMNGDEKLRQVVKYLDEQLRK